MDVWTAPGRDHFTLVNLDGRDNVVRRRVLDFLAVPARPTGLK